jgi:5-methylcytosine-specific restriction endonuclease McrA
MARKCKFTNACKKRVYQKYDGKCADCGRLHGLEIHHLLSVKNGGRNGIDNLVLVCMLCHQKRHGNKVNRLLKDPFWQAVLEGK